MVLRGQMPPVTDADRREQAASWYARLTDAPEVASSEAFRAWIADPENERLYDAIDNAWGRSGALWGTPELEAARNRALAAAGPRRFRLLGRRTLLAAGATVAAAALLLFFVLIRAAAPTLYRTDTGERRIVLLEDGSRLSLDTDSAVAVRLARDRRSITVEHGQAAFEVAHDTSRPFIVDAGGSSVRATGTIFNVDLIAAGVQVTLVRGGVTVSPSDKPSTGAVQLRPGDRLTALSGQPVRLDKVDPADATAWENGRIVFYDEPIGDVIARMNHYAQQHWSIDPAVARLKISGSFNTADTPALLDAISSLQPVAVHTDAAGTIHLAPKRAAAK
jgi:transmembrane sensor